MTTVIVLEILSTWRSATDTPKNFPCKSHLWNIFQEWLHAPPASKAADAGEACWKPEAHTHAYRVGIPTNLSRSLGAVRSASEAQLKGLL